MDNEERVIVRLSSDDLLLLSELVNRHDYASEAEAVRAAVESLLESRFSPEQRAEVLERLRARSELDLNDFTADGTDAGKVLTDVIAKGLESDRKDE
jgi:Arc/MetJ-type ribon-helix-helix transcriptional regulator